MYKIKKISSIVLITVLVIGLICFFPATEIPAANSIYMDTIFITEFLLTPDRTSLILEIDNRGTSFFWPNDLDLRVEFSGFTHAEPIKSVLLPGTNTLTLINYFTKDFAAPIFFADCPVVISLIDNINGAVVQTIVINDDIYGAVSGSPVLANLQRATMDGLDPSNVVWIVADSSMSNLGDPSIIFSFPMLSPVSKERKNDTDGSITFTATQPGRYYYAVVDHGAPTPVIDTSGEGIPCDTTPQTISFTGLTSGEKDVYVVLLNQVHMNNWNTPFSIVIPPYMLSAPSIIAPPLSSSQQNSDTPQTGDNNMSLWTVLSIISFVQIGVLIFFFRKKYAR